MLRHRQAGDPRHSQVRRGQPPRFAAAQVPRPGADQLGDHQRREEDGCDDILLGSRH